MRLRRPGFALLGLIVAVAGSLVAQERTDLVKGAQFDPPVRLKAGEQFIDTGKHVAHAGPLVTDLDADGKPDVLVGNFAGYFQVYKNIGTRAEPVYEDKGLLEVNGEPAKVPNW